MRNALIVFVLLPNWSSIARQDSPGPPAQPPARGERATLESPEPSNTAERKDLLRRLAPRIRDALGLLGSKPPAQERAREILSGIRSDIESLVSMGKAETAVLADIFVGAALHNKGHHGAAIPFAAHAVLTRPKDELALELLASCLLEQGELTQASELLDYARANVNAENPAFLFLSGRLLFAESRGGSKTGKLLEAVKRLEAAVALGFDDPDLARFWLAMCYKSLGMEEKALTEIAKVDRSKLPPPYGERFNWCMFLGGLYASTRQWDKAIEWELRAVRCETSLRNELMAYSALATHYNSAGQFEKGLGYATRVIESDGADGPMLAVAHCAAADAHRALARIDLCIEHATKAVEQKGGPPAVRQLAYFYVGQCYEDGGEAERSREMFKKAFKENPQSQLGKELKKILSGTNSDSKARQKTP